MPSITHHKQTNPRPPPISKTNSYQNKTLILIRAHTYGIMDHRDRNTRKYIIISTIIAS